jgi:hypothetical protein
LLNCCSIAAADERPGQALPGLACSVEPDHIHFFLRSLSLNLFWPTGLLQQQADVETGPRQRSSNSGVPAGRLQAILQAQVSCSRKTDTSDLLQPLLPPEESAQQDTTLQYSSCPVTPEGVDPFPATTAARAAAAEATRAKAAAGPTDNLRAALLGRSASTAAAAVAGKTAEAARFQRQLSVAYALSWVVNILLLAAKLYAYYLSQSKAVLVSGRAQ